MNFSNDEMNLMCIYDTGDRMGTLKALRDMRGELDVDETELLRLTDAVIEKLRTLTDAEYERLELYPDFDDEE